MPEETISQQLQSCLDRLRAGDPTARDELWDLVDERLVVMTRAMKVSRYRRVGQWEQTDDIAQNVRLRLMRALDEVAPATPQQFYGLANLQIRRELIDVIRQHTGRDGGRAPLGAIPEGFQSPTDTLDPVNLEKWREFHEAVEKLPAKLREVFELIYYQGLLQRDAAEVLGVDTSTVKRRWTEARDVLEPFAPRDGTRRPKPPAPDAPPGAGGSGPAAG